MKFNPAEHTTGDRSAAIDVEIAPFGLPGGLPLTSNPRGVIVFAHGSGSSRHSPRNVYVTEALRRQDFATLLFDLLSEREAADRSNVFDISLLSARLIRACETVLTARHTRGLPMGLFGASTGRPDLAGAVLKEVRTSTLLIVGGRDYDVLHLNEAALAVLAGPKSLHIDPDATHFFREPGALDAIIAAANWFGIYCRRPADKHEGR